MGAKLRKKPQGAHIFLENVVPKRQEKGKGNSQSCEPPFQQIKTYILKDCVGRCFVSTMQRYGGKDDSERIIPFLSLFSGDSKGDLRQIEGEVRKIVALSQLLLHCGLSQPPDLKILSA